MITLTCDYFRFIALCCIYMAILLVLCKKWYYMPVIQVKKETVNDDAVIVQNLTFSRMLLFPFCVQCVIVMNDEWNIPAIETINKLLFSGCKKIEFTQTITNQTNLLNTIGNPTQLLNNSWSPYRNILVPLPRKKSYWPFQDPSTY